MNLQQILNELNLTIYGASLVIGAETDEPIKTIHRRWSKWIDDPPVNLQNLERDLAILGYRLKIEKL